MKKLGKVFIAISMVVSLLTGCAKQEQEEVTITLAAAASLKNAYDNELIPMFEENTNVHVQATYASSGDLQTQIENGLDADVFMSAALKQMNALIEEDLILEDTNVKLLENKVVLIVPEDSEIELTGFEDLVNLAEDKVIAIGNPESVPAGQYAKEALENLGIYSSIESKCSLGTDVTAVLNQVAQGSADCGIVYATDAASIDGVKVIAEAPEGSLKTPVIYPVAVVKTSTKVDAAKSFMEFLQTEEALAIFEKYGFTINK